MELPSDATPADKMAHYARTIPEALSEMDEKQGATQQVIQWCESEYRTGDKRRVMTMTREYLTDALVSITTDVGSIAHQITASLDAQSTPPMPSWWRGWPAMVGMRAMSSGGAAIPTPPPMRTG